LFATTSSFQGQEGEYAVDARRCNRQIKGPLVTAGSSISWH
jgi:hypothetical protein